MKRILATLASVALCAATLMLPPVQGQESGGDQKDNAKDKSVKAYRKEEGDARPAWAENALRRSLAGLRQRKQQFELEDPYAELALTSAEEDEQGITSVRLNQMHQGVPVFGGHIVTNLDAKVLRDANGRTFKDARKVDITPQVDAARAIEIAKAALNHQGNFDSEPTATLVVLPHKIKNPAKAGATLCYLVELPIMDGTPQTAIHRYFIDAGKGSVVWHYDNLQRQFGYGTGRTLYSGQQSVPVYRLYGNYYLQDNYRAPHPLPSHDPSWVHDLRGSSDNFNGGFYCITTNNIWGNFTTSHPYSAAADAMFGFTRSWDYFLNVHGRRGIDGNGRRIKNTVHYGVNYENAFYDDRNDSLNYGDGNGSTIGPLISVDVAAHEYTHGLTRKTANLIYQDEPGALNESFSDIFGTAIEFYSGINPDYFIGEDFVTPGVNDGAALRYMNNPPADGQSVDHYSRRVYIGTGIDNGGVHLNSGIQNKAFYLLAEGGTHPLSGITVAGIGRGAAEAIFFRALVFKLFPSAQFRDARLGTLRAAADLYGQNSPQYNSVKQAWDAVGVAVGEDLPPPPPPPTCDPVAEQNCYASGGYWDSSACYCTYIEPPPSCLRPEPCY